MHSEFPQPAGALMNLSNSPGISIGYAVGSLAAWLRQITVCIRGARGSRGSGVIWRDGLIVTNAHVATGKTQTLRIDGGIYLMTFVTNDKVLVSVQDFTNPRRVSVEVWDARQGTRLWKLADHQSPVMAAPVWE